jgi:hypothetical protein
MIVTVPPPQPVKIRFTVNQTPGSSSSLTPATGSGSGSSHGKSKKGVVGGGGGQRAKHARIGEFDFRLIPTTIPIHPPRTSTFHTPNLPDHKSRPISSLSLLKEQNHIPYYSRQPYGSKLKAERPFDRANMPASPLKRTSQDPYSDDDLELDDEEGTRSISPSKLTARQRAKGNKDLQETLVSLPGGFVFYALVQSWMCG